MSADSAARSNPVWSGGSHPVAPRRRCLFLLHFFDELARSQSVCGVGKHAATASRASRRGPKLAETSLAAPIKASALLMDLAGDVHVHLLQMCCDETTIQVRVVHFGSGRFQRAAAAADGTIFPRQQMPEREEKEERDMKERERWTRAQMRQWKSRQQHLDGFESGGADLTVPPPAVSISSPRKKAFLPEARTREKEFPGDISTILLGNDGPYERTHRCCWP